MKLDEQVCSLDLAKRLKELGVKQESLFYWRPENQPLGPYVDYGKRCGDDYVSAFTVAELGEMLPQGVYSYTQQPAAQKYGKWIVKYFAIKQMYQILGDTEADARAKMLIYLIENNLMAKGGGQCLN